MRCENTHTNPCHTSCHEYIAALTLATNDCLPLPGGFHMHLLCLELHFFVDLHTKFIQLCFFLHVF